MNRIIEGLKIVLICIGIGLSFGLYFYFVHDHRVLRIVTSVLSSVNIGVLMMICIYNRHYFTLIMQRPYLKVVIMIMLLIFAALAGSEITLLEQAAITGSKFRFLSGGGMYILNIIIVLVTGLPIYVNEEWKEIVQIKVLSQQYQLLQLEQQNTVFELELLRAKVNPHFLYNVHNSIAGLITKDPPKAEKMVLLLSKFFRLTLNKTSATFHAVADEIEIIRTYLELQQIRFGNQLSYQINASDAILNLQMPSFLLQPLVENAVKHGIEKSTENGFVNIDIHLENQLIKIKVADSGPDFQMEPGEGLGLQMVNNKLKLMFKDQYKMDFYNAPDKYVEISFPKRN